MVDKTVGFGDCGFESQDACDVALICVVFGSEIGAGSLATGGLYLDMKPGEETRSGVGISWSGKEKEVERERDCGFACEVGEVGRDAVSDRDIDVGSRRV
jgi:hypothetical protein